MTSQHIRTRQHFLDHGLVAPVSHNAEPCPVCGESENLVLLVVCKHSFCRPCIEEWTSREYTGTCPVCRADLWYDMEPRPLHLERSPSPEVIGDNDWETPGFIEARSRIAEAYGSSSAFFEDIECALIYRTPDPTLQEIAHAMSTTTQAIIHNRRAPASIRVRLIDTRSMRAHTSAMMSMLTHLAHEELPGRLSDEREDQFVDILDTFFDLISTTWNGREGESRTLCHDLRQAILLAGDPELEFSDSDFFRDQGYPTYYSWMLDRLVEHIVYCGIRINHDDPRAWMATRVSNLLCSQAGTV